MPGTATGTHTLVVALTGGIASGKSTISGMFEQLGVPVIDTDVIAHELVRPGEPLLARLVEVFGKDIVDSQGRLERRKLRELVFSDQDKRVRLEAIMHPAVLKEAQAQILRVSFPYCLLVVPLLVEIGGLDRVDRVLVVDAPYERQVSRLQARDKVSQSDAQAALAAQTTREKRLEMADDVIDNSAGPGMLKHQVEALHQQYLSLSQNQRV